MKRILISSMIMALSMPAFSVTKTVESITVSGGSFSMAGQGGTIFTGGITPLIMEDAFQGAAPATTSDPVSTTPSTHLYYATSLALFDFGTTFGPVAVYTDETDGVNSGFPLPSGEADDATTDSLSLDLDAWIAFWNGTSFRQGSTSTLTPGTRCSGPSCSTPIVSTYNTSTGAYTASWEAAVVGGAFNGQLASWSINGVVTLDNTAPVITLNDTTNPLELVIGTPYVEQGATALDNMDGTVTVDISGTVDENTTGSYEITYSVTDDSSNTATIIRTVNVTNGNAPVVTINGDNPVNVNEDTSYTDAGATATDAEDDDQTLSIVTTNPVDITQPGTYTVTYTVTDSTGNVGQATRTVNVLDITPPVITLSGDSTVVTGLNDYIEPGASVTDNSGEILSAVITGSVNQSVGGTYYLTYNAEDSAGNAATPVMRTVIIDGIGPEIVLNEGPSVSINVGETYVDAGATATDDYGTAINVVTDCSGVDTSTAGIYSCSFSADDGFGNETTATREVLVIDTAIAVEPIKPVLSATQNSNTTSIILTTGGVVTVATDMNANQLLTSTFDWSASDSSITPTAGTDNATFSFDPSALADGLYTLRVTVNAGEADETSSSRTLRIISTAPVLSDSTDSDGDGIMDDTEGFNDADNDGIPDYLDPAGQAANMMSANESTMVSSQGTVRLGAMASANADLTNGSFSPVISAEDITANTGRTDTDVAQSCINGCFDFEVTDLTPGAIIQIVLPVASDTIKSNAAYRKYSSIAGWQNFNTDSNDRIASADMRNGVCPSASATNTWIEGLFPGDRCIRLTIQDGGSNDEDGAANGTIVDPSGVAQTAGASVNTVDGGCSMATNANARDHAEWLLVAGFIALLGWFKMSRRKA